MFYVFFHSDRVNPCDLKRGKNRYGVGAVEANPEIHTQAPTDVGCDETKAVIACYNRQDSTTRHVLYLSLPHSNTSNFVREKLRVGNRDLNS